jgi:hypothetical protein
VSLALAEVSPKQDYALGVTQGDGTLVLAIFGEGDQPSSVQRIESVGLGASHISLEQRGQIGGRCSFRKAKALGF